MKTSVQWTYGKQGNKPCLCFAGRKYTFQIGAGYPIRVVRRPIHEYDTSRPVDLNGKAYPVERAIATIRGMIPRMGITAAAEELLNRALTTQDIDEELYPNEDEEIGDMSDDSPANNDSPNQKETTPVSKKNGKKPAAKKVGKKPGAKKVAAKGPKAAKAPRGPSKISQAVEWMRAEVKKLGGPAKLERGSRKELQAKAAAKFGLAPSTCSIQYNKQVLSK